MSAEHPSDYHEWWESVPPFQLHGTSYKLGNAYYCAVDDVDPGAIISRSSGSTRGDAEQKAVTRARERLEASRSRMKTV